MATITKTRMTSQARRNWWRQILLGCGIVAPAWWVAMDVVGSLRYAGYSYIDQTISELSAEGGADQGVHDSTKQHPVCRADDRIRDGHLDHG